MFPCVLFFVYCQFFFLVFLDSPAVLLLLLEQGEKTLEDHTRLFVEIYNFTRYPDDCLSLFYHASLNFLSRAKLFRDGPQEDFAAFVEWVLVSCGSPFTIDIADVDTSPTLDPEPSLPTPRCAEHQLEPNVINEPLPERSSERRITLEPEPLTTSDQVRERQQHIQ